MSETAPQPAFDPSAPHHAQPRLRPVRGFPARVNEQNLLGLADARQITDKVVVVAPAFQVVLPLMNGERTVDQIVTEVGRGLTREHLEPLIAQLDDAGLLMGPRFDAIRDKMRADFDAASVLPPASSAAFAEALVGDSLGEGATPAQIAEAGSAKLREVFDAWMAKALESVPNPSFDTLPKAIVAPHVDYGRGWLNYAHAWGRLRVCDRPDRVIILGANHFGEGTGVVGCDKGYETPFGTCEADRDVVEGLRARLGEVLYAHRYDHEHEHSIELQVPWIQHCLGRDDAGNFPRVFGALVHDPAINNGESYDGQGVAIEPFISALRDVLASLPGRTLVVSSADLSHAGPQFGDKQPLAGDEAPAAEARNRVFQHDREMIEHIQRVRPEDLVAAMAWQQNPTRWCSTGNIVATMKTVQPERVDILNYAAAMDQQGSAMVSSLAAVMS